jgi:hypothetical protein
MKNKILFLGGLCLLLASGLVFTACSDEAELVTYVETQLSPPGNVTATFAKVDANATYKSLIVKWDAVDGASSYSVVATQDGKKSIVTVSSSGHPVAVSGVITDIDKWEYTSTNSGLSKGTYKIGVIANPRETHNTLHSDIAWAATAVTIDE